MKTQKKLRPFLVAGVLALGYTSFVVSGHTEITAPDPLKVAMGNLKDAATSKKVQLCQKDWSIFRRLGNVCTKALDSLQEPVATAHQALVAEEAKLRPQACPSIVDYGCTPEQIRMRDAADHLANAADRLRLTIENDLEDYKTYAKWDRILVKDNRVDVEFAIDFIREAQEEYQGYLSL